ncbi:MAG: SUMF1/EgtB/PvdO family nonheme iron enzyme [Bacteroidota bacterium]
MPEFSKHIDTFPLEHLFRRLELADFQLSPADRLRALQVLGGPAKAYLNDPVRLKELLAPVLVRSEAEQLKFYEIFDQYYHDISAPWEAPPLPKEGVEWWKWLLILPLLAVLFYTYYALTQREVVTDDFSLFIAGPDSGQAGDTVRFENKTTHSGEQKDWRWRWSYINADEVEELFDTTSTNWTFVVPEVDSLSHLREVRLQAWPADKDTMYEARQAFIVFCPSPPTVEGISGSSQLEAGQEVDFAAIISPNGSTQDNWSFEWDFGDGRQEEGEANISHSYQQNGQYTLRLTTTDTTANGFCSISHSLEIKVGREQAFLPLAEFERDQLTVFANWGWGFYLVLGALGLGLLYYWVRWLTRQTNRNPVAELAKKQKEALSARFAHSDKAPYFIPLRDQNSHISTAGIQLRLGDALRIRQEGLRRELDLAGTLHNTIEKGGYPEITYRYATQPSEYLCLIDEQSGASHLGQLFRYLAGSLKEQDVHLEIYYYRQHFNRFWNHHHPQGRTIDQLQRAYGNYRLLVMGDLHDLINPYARKTPGLRSAAANVLRQWPLRLLLTPVPPVSWSYREKLLARVFSVFPVDSEGLAAAALYIENDGEILPDGNAFDRWQATLKSVRQDIDTEHRNWRRWRFIEEYLNNYDPALVRWFSALAVFPVPSWEMTIAIGRALGIEIRYNYLLILSRIPSLQSDRFDERLRREMMADLSPEDERLARRAVQEELSAVQLLSEGSHAHRDLETALAVQDFALAPNNPDYQDTMRFMLEQELLTRAQEADLDRIVDRLAQESNIGGLRKKMAPAKMSLRDWLGRELEEESDEIPETTPQQRRDLWRAICLTLAYIALLVIGWKLGGSEYLYKFAFAEDPRNRVVNLERPLRNYFLIKETQVIDSAIIYNNLGIDQAEIDAQTASVDTLGAAYFRAALEKANSIIHSDGEEFNGIPISYTLANTNLSKLYLNAAVQALNGYLSDSLGQAILPEALQLLDAAYRSDTTRQDVWHTRGIIHYYAGSPEDSSLYYFQLLDSLNYFPSLDYTPTLETLLGRERSRIISISADPRDKQRLAVSVEYYLDNTIYAQGGDLVLSPNGRGGQPGDLVRSINPGYGTAQFSMGPPSDKPGALETLRLILSDPKTDRIIDTLEEAISHNWFSRRRIIETPPAPSRAETAFRLEAELIDAANRIPLTNIEVVLREQATRVTQGVKEFSTRSDSYGRLALEGNLKGYEKSAFLLSIEAPGYEVYELLFESGEELTSTLPYVMKSPLRLERQIPFPRMELISAGSFEMGDESGKYNEDERPIREVNLSSYFMGIYEVTFADYDLFCEATNRPKPDDYGWGRANRPVINVSWMDAIEYCNWLSTQHNLMPAYVINPKLGSVSLGSTRAGLNNGYRLPTEAEWEYAARGGIMENKSHTYAGSANLNEVGWYERNSKDQTQPAGQLRPNNAGMYDMSGNVWEWCYDWFGGYPSEASTDPTGPYTGSHRIIRGGAWIQPAEDCRVSVRQYRRPEQRTVYIGFRLVRNR